jgi:hypothetical protein
VVAALKDSIDEVQPEDLALNLGGKEELTRGALGPCRILRRRQRAFQLGDAPRRAVLRVRPHQMNDWRATAGRLAIHIP